MSLVYAKKSDEIGSKGHQELSGYDLYESLLTYVAHMDLVGDPFQDTCHACIQDTHY